MTSFYSNSGGVDPQSAFADALARARQIAAKISSNPASEVCVEASTHKRPFEDQEPEAKKAANDPIAAQLRSIADSSPFPSAGPPAGLQAAAAAASQINQKLGTATNAPPPMGGLGMHAGMGAVVNEEWQVPDRMVGLIIGKGGEQIASIQAESGCKVQFAPDSMGRPDRPCTLTGSRESIMRAKELMSNIIARGQGGPDPNNGGMGESVVEIMVPGNKVGLVIGKGGETIRQLQEQLGVKMVMIQDSNQPTSHEKPLRISGDPMKCQQAKDMILDLIAEKDGMDGYNSDYGSRMGGGGGMGGKNSMEIRVPRTAVGVIIGKGGDMIKKIQTDTGARVQFMPDDGQSPDRTCTITGNGDKVQEAANMISDLINNTVNRQGGPPMRGRGRGRGGFGGGQGGPGGGRGHGGFQDEASFPVPADKCGLVIGKGGETIREINRQSGAHVELSRQPGNNPAEKIFIIRGNPQEIGHAQQLIAEKAGVPPPGNGVPPGAGGPPGGPPGGPNGYDQYGGQYGGPQYGQQNPQQGGGPNYGGPQGWGGGYPGQWPGQSSPPDPNSDKQGQGQGQQDPNAAAWAAYYAQYYGQYGQGTPQQQQQQQQQPQQQQQQAPQSGQQQNANYAAPSVNPVTGQLDYSAAWAEYYRQQGMHYHAQAIMAQAGGQQGSGGTPQPPQ